MKTITLTERELAELRRAVEMSNDMMNDSLFDGLYIQPGHEKTFSSDEMKAIREEAEEQLESLMALRSLLLKAGGRTNDKGYSI